MQIQLKQTEIVEALKQYISRQGFNLANKTVEVSFTAGRSGAGLIADIGIEDIQLPELQADLEFGADGEAQRPALTVVPQGQANPVTGDVTQAAEVTSTAPAAEEAAAPKTSLFG